VDVGCEGVVGGLPVRVFVGDEVAVCEEVEVVHCDGRSGREGLFNTEINSIQKIKS